MAKRRSEIGKKGKHGRDGLDVTFDKIAKKRKKTLFVVVTIIIVLVVILASLYYFFILDEEPEEEKEVLSTATPHNACYPNETALFRFTVYNPENEDDVFAPMVSGLPSDWELNLPSTIPVEGKKSIDEEFSITPSLAAQNKTYLFRLNLTSENTQHTYSLEYELTVFELLVDVELTTEVPQKDGNPNENITFSFTIYNPNNNVDIFLPSISGLPSDWTITVPDNISVLGNDLKIGSFFIVPSPETALNKTYSFMLNVISGNTGRTYTLKYHLTVFQTFGVELLCYNNSHDADPGRSAYYAIVVKNTGNGVDTFTISYNVSNMPNNWSVSFEFDSMGISGFDSKVVICNISTDSNTSKGRYDIEIIATSDGGPSDSIWLNTSLILDFGEDTINNTNKVQVNYIGTLIDGAIFDTNFFEVANNSDYPKDEGFSSSTFVPLKVALSDASSGGGYTGVIPGFEEGLIGMKVGETKVIRIPPEKAYTVPGGEDHHLYGKTLIFEITLVSIDT